MKYVTGKFTCGHTGDIYINGWNAKELREYAQERFHTEVCPHCMKNEKYEAAVRHAQALKLPDLVNDDEETRVNGTIIREKLIATFIHEAKPFYRKVREAYSYNGDALAATCWICSRETSLGLKETKRTHNCRKYEAPDRVPRSGAFLPRNHYS